jgi:hypothetical protein
VITVFNDNNVAVTYDCRSPRLVKLAFAATVAADGAKEEAVSISGISARQ